MSKNYPIKPAKNKLSVETQNENIINEAVASLSVLNEGQRGTRLVTGGMAKTVAKRSLEKTAGETYSLRRHRALAEVAQFANTIQHDKPITASAFNTDLLPIAHPKSTRAHKLNPKNVEQLRARWYADDPRVSDPLVVSLLASAFTANPISPEYEYAIARLTAMGPREVTLEALVAALKPGANKFFWMRQLRSKKNGRFIKMYGALKKLVRRAGGVFNLAGNMVSANPNTEDIVMELPDGRLVKTNTTEAEGVKALIPSQQGEGGYSKNPVKSAVDSSVTNEEDLEYVDSPEGWGKDSTWKPSQEDKDYYGENLDLGTMFVDENDNYEVLKFQKANFPAKNRFEMAQQKEAEENDVIAYGKGEDGELNPDLPVYFIRRKDGKDKDFAAVQSWADVQALTAADEELYGQDKAPNPKRPVSAGEPVPSELKVGDVVDYKSLPGDMVPGDPDANDARIAAYEKKLAKFNEEGGEFPLDPRRDYYLMDDGTIIDGDTGEVLRDSQGSTEPSEDTDAPEAEPIAQLPEPTEPTEPTTDAVTVPEGYYDVTRSEYFPEGAIDGQTSPDFTDDPAQLAQEYSAKDLTTALEQAVVGNKENKATGFGQLPFEDGLEVVPAEALYKALEEQGEDADQILDDIYAAGGGDSKAISDAAPEQQAAFDEAPPLTPEEEKWFNLSRNEITNRYNAQAILYPDMAPDWFKQTEKFYAQLMPSFQTYMAAQRDKKGTLKDKIRKFWRETVSKLFGGKKWQWQGKEYFGREFVIGLAPNFPDEWRYDDVFTRKYFDNWLDSPSEEVLDAIDNGDFPEAAQGTPSEQEIPPLIDGLTEDEKNEFLETGDYKKYLPENKVYGDSDVPEDYAVLNNEAWTELEGDLPEDAPEGFSLNPVDIANDYNNEDLIGELRRALEPGNPTPGYGILGMDTPEGEEYVANVPGEAIRDALQLQGVDTDELVDAIYAEGFQGQDGDEPTDEEVQDALEGENVEEGQEPTAESEEEEITPAEEPTPSDEEGPPAPPSDSGPGTADPEGPVQLTTKAKDLEPGDVTASDFFTVEEVFSDAESEAIKPGSVWIVGYYPGHVSQKTKLWNAETAIKVFRNVTPPTKGDLPELSKPKPKEMDPEGKIFKDKELDIFVPKNAEARSKYLDLLDQYNKDLAQSQTMWADAPGEGELASWKAVDLTAPFTPDSPVGVTTVKATEVQSGDITFKKEKGNDFYEFFIVESVEEVDGKAVVKGYYPGHVSQTKEWNATTEITVMRGATDFPAPGTGPALSRPKKGEPDIQQKYIDFNAAKKLSAEGFTPPLDPNTLALTTDAGAAPADKKATPTKPKAPSYPAFSGDKLKQIAAEANGDPIKFMELLRNEEIVVLDFETAADGAFNKQTPIQVAWTKFKNGEGIATGSLWMNPEVSLGKWYKDKSPEDILKDPSGNPISDEFLANQPSIAEQMEKLFAQFGPDTIVAAHNMPFDGGILKRYAAQLGIEYKPAGEIDTLVLSRLVINGENGEHALEKVAQRYGISPDGDWHDAVTDVEALYPILEALMAEMAKTKQGIQALGVAANEEDYETKLAEYNASKQKKDIAETNLVTSKIVKDAFDGKEDLPTVDQAIDSVPKDLPNSEEATTATTAKPTELSDGDNQVESVFGDQISNNWVEDDENTTSLGPVPVEDWKPGDFFRALNGGWYEVLEVVPDPASDKRVFVKRRLLANGQEPENINPWVKYQAYEIRRRNNDVEETVTPEAAPAPVADEETSFENWQGYDIKQDADGVYYADGISGSDVQKLRNGQLTPPQLPFFAPIGGGNKPDQGDGYFFSINGNRFWGKFGAAGALVRRKNNKGEYEYFLAKRSSGLSQGGGKWGYPGGAHKNKADAEATQATTAIAEFMEEVGGEITPANSIDKGSYFNAVAPDWTYTTNLFEVGPDEMKDLSPKDGENSETGWFTSEQITKMAEDGDLQSDFSETASTILGLLNDDPDTTEAITPEPGDVAPSVLGTTFDTSKWKKVAGQAGSNQGAFYVDPATGQQYYVKKPKSELHAANEVLASALYEQSGLDVGRSYIGTDKGGNVVIVSPVVDGTQGNLSQFAANQDILDQIKKGFAVDAWMNNYDVIGLEKDNIIVADGKPFRIDAGGALLFRAQGVSKAEELDTNVSEQINSLRDPDTNVQAASVFGDMTDAEIAESVKLVEAISESKIDELVDAAFAGDIPNLDSQSMADKLKENLKRRRKELIEQYNVQETAEPEAPSVPETQEEGGQSVKLAVNPSTDGDEEAKIANLTAQIQKAIKEGNDIVFVYNGKIVKISPEEVKTAGTGNVNVVGTLPNGQYRSFTLLKMEQSDAPTPTPAEAPEAPEQTGIFKEYSPDNSLTGAENTPLSELGFDPEEEITIYRGVPKGVEDINSGDWVTSLEQLAKDYAGADGDVISKTVKAKDLLTDPSSGEGAYTEEMVYSPAAADVSLPEPTVEPTETEKPTEIPQDQKQKLVEDLSSIAEAIFGKAPDKDKLKELLADLKDKGGNPDLIDSIVTDLDAEPVVEPSTPEEKVAQDIAQELFPEDPEIDTPEALTPEEIQEALSDPSQTDPELIWQAVKDNYDSTVLDNGHIVVSSVMHGDVRYDVVVRRTGENSFGIYHRITNPDGTTKVYTLKSRLHSAKALNNKISTQIDNSKTKPNYIKSRSKAETAETLLPTSIAAIPTAKEAYVAADGTVLEVGTKVKVVNPTHSKFGMTATVTTLKKKIGADGSYVYTDYVKVKYSDGEKNQIVAKSLAPIDSDWTWGDPTPPPSTDGDGGDGGGTPPAPPTQGPSAPESGATPEPTAAPASASSESSSPYFSPEALDGADTIQTVLPKAMEKNGTGHLTYFGADTYSDYKSFLSGMFLKDPDSKNMVPGIIVANAKKTGGDDDELISYGVVTGVDTNSNAVSVSYFDGPLKGTSANLTNSNVYSQEALLSVEQAKELGIDVSPDYLNKSLEASKGKKEAYEEELKNKALKAAQEAEAQKLKAQNEVSGGGFEIATFSGQANWSESPIEAVPSLEDALRVAKGDDSLAATSGVAILVDADEIDAQTLKVQKVLVKGNKKQIRVTFKLTDWAGNKVLANLSGKDNFSKSDTIEMVKWSPHSSGLLKAGNFFPTGPGKFSVDYKKSGTSVTGPAGEGTFTLHRASKSADASDVDFHVYYSSSDHTVSLHNQAELLFPENATAEDIAQALSEIGIENARPATSSDLIGLVENKLIWQLGGKPDGKKNYTGELRELKLKQIEQEFGVTAADVEVRQNPTMPGELDFLMPKSVGENLAKKVGKKYFYHKLTAQGYSGTAQERAKFIYNFVVSGGVLATAQRWNNGVNVRGMSSEEDLRANGGNYVFTYGSNNKSNSNGYTPHFTYDAAELFRNLGYYGHPGDGYGHLKSKEMDVVESLKNGHQFMFKSKLSWAALANLDIEQDVRQELLALLTDNNKDVINGVNIADILKGI
jgi:DNA polymerase III epsilon subunit-like protein/8-oxo-dGTP pyrophosphatase MutT (NUDIX family)